MVLTHERVCNTRTLDKGLLNLEPALVKFPLFRVIHPKEPFYIHLPHYHIDQTLAPKKAASLEDMVVANPRYRGLHQYTPLSKGEPSTSSNPEDFEEQHGDSCNLNEVFNKPHLASPGRLDGCKKHARVAQMSFATLQFSNPTYLEDEFQEEYAHSRATFDIVGSGKMLKPFYLFEASRIPTLMRLC